MGDTTLVASSHTSDAEAGFRQIARREALLNDLAPTERRVLDRKNWLAGTITSRGETTQTMNLPLDGMTLKQRDAAMTVMLKYGIAARVVHSRSLGDIDVMRIKGYATGCIQSLRLAMHMSNPES